MRDVEEFKEISAGGSTRVDVTVGPEMSIQVTADDNILPHVRTDVSKERLKIYVDESYSSNVGVDVKITVPELRWIRGSGFEWLYRLATEPRRLWKRYLRNNPRFVLGMLHQTLRPRRFPLEGLR